MQERTFDIVGTGHLGKKITWRGDTGAQHSSLISTVAWIHLLPSFLEPMHEIHENVCFKQSNGTEKAAQTHHAFHPQLPNKTFSSSSFQSTQLTF